MTTETTRRALFGGAGIAAVALSVPALATTGSASSGISPELMRLIQAVTAAESASEQFDEEVTEPTQERFFAACEAVPHVIIRTARGDFWATSNREAISLAKHFRKHSPAGADRKVWRALLAAHLRRERAVERINKEMGASAAIATSNALSDAVADAEWAVAQFLCNSPADLHAKLLFMTERQMDSSVQLLEFILADAARLRGEG